MKNSHIFIGIVYIPPKDSTYKIASDFHEDLADEIIDKKSKGHVIIAGDLNSRSSELPDFLPSEEDDIFFPRITCPRYNLDKVVNSYGRKLINLCINSRVQIMNGRNLFSSNTNQYTCIRPNGSSVVDILLTSSDSAKYITDFSVLPETVNSDHRPLSFRISITRQINRGLKATRDHSTEMTKYVYDPTKTKEYILRLENSGSTSHYEKLICKVSDSDIAPSQVVDCFYSYINGCIENIFKKLKPKSHRNTFPSNK